MDEKEEKTKGKFTGKAGEKSPEEVISEVRGTGEKRIGMNMFIALLLITIIIAAVFMLISGIMKYNRLEEEKKELQAQLELYEKRIEEMQYEINSPVDYDYIVKKARQIGMYFPDEEVYYNDKNK